MPKASRIAVLVNPANTPVAETTLRDIPEAARALGLQIHIVNASTSPEIETASAAGKCSRCDISLLRSRESKQEPIARQFG